METDIPDNLRPDTNIIINDEISIPESEVSYRFDTSSGPGGQHANRSATRVTLLFDVQNSPALDEKSRHRLLKKLGHHLDKNGLLHISVQDTRSQKQNREIALSRFMVLIAGALKKKKKRKKTSPPTSAIERAKAEQQKHSERKKERGTDWSKET